MLNVILLSRAIGSNIVFRLHLRTAKVFNFTRCTQRENCLTIKTAKPESMRNYRTKY